MCCVIARISLAPSSYYVATCQMHVAVISGVCRRYVAVIVAVVVAVCKKYVAVILRYTPLGPAHVAVCCSGCRGVLQ